MHSSRLDIPLVPSCPRLGAIRRVNLLRRLREQFAFDRSSLLVLVGVCSMLAIGWFSVERENGAVGEHRLLAMLPGSERALARQQAVAERAQIATAKTQAKTKQAQIAASTVTLLPDRRYFERYPSTHLPVDPAIPTRIRVVTVRARVTGYTAYDHRITHPQWADGVVAWHPDGRKRRVGTHPYGLATDWSQFPAGATFINVPGYLEQTYPSFPQRFLVVDDACGAARKARRRGGQPVIDVRFQHRSSIVGRNGWGTRELEVEVVFPAGFEIPASLRPWVVREEWRTYHHGRQVG